MYIPKSFEISEKEAFDFIQANAFGQLISTHQGRLISSHLPFLIDRDKQLITCHLAKANPQWQGIEDQEVLLTFQGDHDYISPTWYQTSGVPTWNYQAVHLYGRVTVIQQADKLAKLVEGLTQIYESGSKNPWQGDYNPAMLKAIVGLEISITQVQGKYKLSQNKSKEDQKSVIKNLKARSSSLYKTMENYLNS